MSIINIIEPIKLLLGHHDDTGSTGKGCFMDVISYLNGDDQITDQSTCVCFVVRPIVIWLNDYLIASERSRMLPYIERAMGSTSYDPAVFVPRAKAAARFAMRCREITQASAKNAASAVKWAESAASAAASAAARFAMRRNESAQASAKNAKNAASAAESAEGSAALSATWAESAAESAATWAEASAKWTAIAAESAEGSEAAWAEASAKWAAWAEASAKLTASAEGSAERAATLAQTRQELITAAFAFLDEALPIAIEHPPVVAERARKLIELTT